MTVIDTSTGAVVDSFLAYDANFTGGVHVAMADLNNDGTPDIITGPGPGGGPEVKVFDGTTFALLYDFMAYDPNFAGGVSVASGDVFGIGQNDIITGAGPGGGPQVNVYDGSDLAPITSFFAYNPAFAGGVNVAAGSVAGTGADNVVTAPGPGGGPQVNVFDGTNGTLLSSFFAYNPAFTGGVTVATGNFDDSGTPEILTAPGAGGGPQLGVWTVYPTPALVSSFLALGGTDNSGVNIGAVENGDGTPDSIAATSAGTAGELDLYDVNGDLLSMNAVSSGGTAGFFIGSLPADPQVFSQAGGGSALGATLSPPPPPPPDYEKMPAATQNSVTAVLYVTQKMLSLNKTITLVNNSTQEVFPFIEGENTGQYVAGNANTYYDPPSVTGDAANQEYRAYIGYKDAANGSYYFGLTPNSSITINVPLVFWDSARIHFATSALLFTNTLQFGPNAVNNPWSYYNTEGSGAATLRFIDDPKNANTNALTTISGTNGDTSRGDYPVVMYYHAISPQQPANSAPEQLLEYTIRDPYQNVLNSNLPVSILGPLFNYDVSAVDSIAFPATMEAPVVPLLNQGSGTAAFGWIGIPQSVSQIQTAIANFTSNDPAVNGLGQYFGGLGWPSYFVPNTSAMGIKLPATKNVIENSNFNVVQSIYQDGVTNHFYLTSGGVMARLNTNSQTGGITNGIISSIGSDMITGVDPKVLATLTPGMLLLNPTPAYFAAGTTILKTGLTPNTSPQTGFIQLVNGNQPASALLTSTGGIAFTFIGSQYSGPGTANATNTLTLSDKSVIGYLQPGMVVQISIQGVLTTIGTIDHTVSSSNQVVLQAATTYSGDYKFTFTGGVTDPIAQTLLNLWYAWADYYVTYVTGQNPYQGTILNGTIQAQTNALTFTQSLPKLFPGMTVNGPGLPTDGSTTFISSISGNTVFLSQVAAQGQSGATYTFGLPASVARSNYVPSPTTNPLRLSFNTPAALAQAVQFAATEYSVMEAFSQIPQVQGTIDPAVGGQAIGPGTTSLTVKSTINLPNSGSVFIQITQAPGYVTATYNGKTPTSIQLQSVTGSGTLVGGGLVYFSIANQPFSSLAFLQNIIGGNVGQIPNTGPGGVASQLALLYRDQSKSVERGVYNFNAVDPSLWYPDPATPTPGALTAGNSAAFDIYTMDPYVWFIHKQLDVSAYAFSLDDDAANVQAQGATKMTVAIGAIQSSNPTTYPNNSLPNLAEWSNGAPYGPKNATGVTASLGTGKGGADQLIGLPTSLFYYLGQPNPADNVIGAFVLGPGVVPGTRILSYSIGTPNTITLDHKLNLTAQQALTPGTYSFFGAVNVTGTINPQGSSPTNQTISGIDPASISVLNSVTLNGSLLPGSLTVTGPGIQAATALPGATTSAVGQFPTAVVTGDFNGDKNQDMAVTNYESGTVSILLGNGNGTFLPQTPIPTGASPFSVATGDFNNDSKLDLVTANLAGQSFTVLLGNGNGTFSTLTLPDKDIAGGLHSPLQVAVGDLGNGQADIAATNTDGTLTVIMGNGNGTFQAPKVWAPYAGAQFWGIAIANMGTGHPDLVAAAYSAWKVAVFPGNGDGTFGAPILTGIGGGQNDGFLAVGDFNGDGKMDVATSNRNSNSVSILLGNGTFQPQVMTYSVGVGPAAIVVSDLNNDKKLDLAVANLGSSSGSVLLGNGNGTFAPAQTFNSGQSPLGIAAAAFNPSDATLDLVFANFVGQPKDTVTLANNTVGPSGQTRVTQVGANSVLLDLALDANRKAGTYRFKIS